MVFVLPAGAGFSDVLDINLGKLVAGSLLVNGFSRELPSVAQISVAVKKQNIRVEKGGAADTGMSADQFAASSKPLHGLNTIDNNSYKAAVHPALTPAQLSQFFDAQGLPIGSPGGAGVVPISNSRGRGAP
jgi:hypothetical protein